VRPARRGDPDVGNLDKLLDDALEAAGWLLDDAQIVSGLTGKIYSEEPGYWIRLSAYPAEPTSATEWHSWSVPSGRLEWREAT
jgi:hypothetical protein